MKNTFIKNLLLCSLTGLLFMTAAAVPSLAESVTEETTEAEGAKSYYWQVEDAGKYVTLGEYTGLEVEKTIYTLSEEDAQIELDNILYEQSELIDVNRGAELGDTVNCDLTISVRGDEETVPNYSVELGYGELGNAFDEEINGHLAGETVKFSVTYDEETEEDIFEEWLGEKVDFTVKINSVQTTSLPQFNDEWVKENSEFEDTESYMEDLTAKLQERSDRQSTLDAASSALSAAMENAEFDGYPDKLFHTLQDQQVEQYQSMADMFGISLEELYENYELTEEEIADQTEELIEQLLFVTALSEKEGIEVTDEDVKAFAEENYEDYGYEDPETMLEDDEEGDLVLSALTEKVSLFLLDKADVTEKEYDYSEEDLIFDDSSAYDDWDDEDDDWEEDEDDDWSDEDYWELETGDEVYWDGE